MASLEAIMYPLDPFCYNYGSTDTLFAASLSESDSVMSLPYMWSYDYEDYVNTGFDYEIIDSQHQQGDVDDQSRHTEPATETERPAANPVRRKRRRAKIVKNKEEIENQRMTHIAVERNRRKQMNEYLAVLRSLMPPSYAQRGDQASIVGGAINFVKELEQLLQAMEVHKIKVDSTQQKETETTNAFAEFFTLPQYASRAGQALPGTTGADIEVTMVESHANIKILSKKRPRQLLQLMAGLQGLCLNILHLNVTTGIHQLVLYSLSVKIEEGCLLNTVDEVAAAVNQMLHRIAEDSAFC